MQNHHHPTNPIDLVVAVAAASHQEVAVEVTRQEEEAVVLATPQTEVIHLEEEVVAVEDFLQAVAVSRQEVADSLQEVVAASHREVADSLQEVEAIKLSQVASRHQKDNLLTHSC